jgi:hypothetical protein|tara:strand:- start:774 stop:1625 length:852 start_codon:yes stop_codon:yes gene_type:complete
MMKRIFYTILLTLISCTENPFGGEKKMANRTISGRVKLDKVDFYPSGYHNGVLVWSEGLGLQATTDIDGSFELTLPASSESSSGAITDGDYTLQFFIGNYKLSSVTITFAAGQVVNDEKVINLEGELRRDVTLTRLAGVHTNVYPPIITSGFDSDVITKVQITPDKTDIHFHLRKLVTRDFSIYTGLLIREADSKKLAYTVDIDTASIMKEYINRPSQTLEFVFNYTDVNLPSGIYEVIPYLVLDREDVPEPILNTLGSGYDSFSQNYFKYPFYRTGGELVIE